MAHLMSISKGSAVSRVAEGINLERGAECSMQLNHYKSQLDNVTRRFAEVKEQHGITLIDLFSCQEIKENVTAALTAVRVSTGEETTKAALSVLMDAVEKLVNDVTEEKGEVSNLT